MFFSTDFISFSKSIQVSFPLSMLISLISRKYFIQQFTSFLSATLSRKSLYEVFKPCAKSNPLPIISKFTIITPQYIKLCLYTIQMIPSLVKYLFTFSITNSGFIPYIHSGFSIPLAHLFESKYTPQQS